MALNAGDDITMGFIIFMIFLLFCLIGTQGCKCKSTPAQNTVAIESDPEPCPATIDVQPVVEVKVNSFTEVFNEAAEADIPIANKV